MYDVFISYSSKDKEALEATADFLENHKIKCWMAYRDAEAGSTYAASIVNAIKNAEIVLVIFSANADKSAHVLRELETAFKYNKTVIPFMLDDVELSDGMEYYLGSTHWLRALTRPIDTHFNGLASVINNYLGRKYENAPIDGLSEKETAAGIPHSESRLKIKLISGTEVTKKDIRGALNLDRMVYNLDDSVQFSEEKSFAWHEINPDIYFMLKDTDTDEVVGYVNLAPITKECYDKILSGQIWDIEISEDDVLPYDFPGIYYLNFTSIVVHPAYRNSGMVIKFIDAIAEKLSELYDREIYFEAMLADAVTNEGEKFCRLFGMKKEVETTHGTKIYRAMFIPPQFNKCSRSIGRLFERYASLKIDEV